MINKVRNICCIGAGYVGGPTMAVFADKCPNLNIFVVDKNKQRVDAWNSEDLTNFLFSREGLINLFPKKVRIYIFQKTSKNIFLKLI